MSLKVQQISVAVVEQKKEKHGDKDLWKTHAAVNFIICAVFSAINPMSKWT